MTHRKQAVLFRKKTKELLRVLTPTFPDKPRQHRQKLFASFSRKRRPCLAFYGSASTAVPPHHTSSGNTLEPASDEVGERLFHCFILAELQAQHVGIVLYHPG
jgi:hypothetical protein